MNNQRRIYTASRAVDAYKEAKGDRGDRYAEEPIEDVLGDLLTDLRHFCADRELDFAKLVWRSEYHFDAESEVD